MSRDSPMETGVRRVLAVFDAASSSASSLDALAEMAAALEASLELLFLEDLELKQVAGLPLARQVNLRTGEIGPLATTELEAETRAAEARLRRWLARIAAKRHIRWSVRTVRGEIGDMLPLASDAADLLVLRHRAGWERHRPAASQPIAVARQASRSVLLLEQGAGPPRAFTVLYRGGPQGSSALSLGVRLAAAAGRPLHILVPDAETVEAARDQFDAIAASGAGLRGARARISRLSADDALSDIAARARDGMLVIGADDPVLRPAGAWERLKGAARYLLLMR